MQQTLQNFLEGTKESNTRTSAFCAVKKVRLHTQNPWFKMSNWIPPKISGCTWDGAWDAGAGAGGLWPELPGHVPAGRQGAGTGLEGPRIPLQPSAQGTCLTSYSSVDLYAKCTVLHLMPNGLRHDDQQRQRIIWRRSTPFFSPFTPSKHSAAGMARFLGLMEDL